MSRAPRPLGPIVVGVVAVVASVALTTAAALVLSCSEARADPSAPSSVTSTSAKQAKRVEAVHSPEEEVEATPDAGDERAGTDTRDKTKARVEGEARAERAAKAETKAKAEPEAKSDARAGRDPKREAGPADATTPTPTSTSPDDRPSVRFRRQPIFFLAHDALGHSSERAARMSAALERALATEAVGVAPEVEVRQVSQDRVELYVKGHFLGEIRAEDAAAAGARDIAEFSRQIEEGLGKFVEGQMRRVRLQGLALHVFFSILILVVGSFALYGLRALLGRAEEYLDDHSEAIRPIRLFGVPVVGAETVEAGLTLALALGRIVVQLTLVIVTLSLALSQFETTRDWVTRVLHWATNPVVRGVEALIAAIPGVVLAIIIVFAAKTGLRVIGVLLEVGADGESRWLALDEKRAFVVRILATIAVVVVGATLAVAAAFGRFHSPVEILVLTCAAAFALATGPTLASGAAGLVMIWRGTVRVGQTVRAGPARGRVTGVSPFDIEIEGADGRRQRVPALALLVTPIEVTDEAPRARLLVRTRRPSSMMEGVDAFVAALKRQELVVAAELVGFDESTVSIELSPDPRAEREDVVKAVAELDRQGVLSVVEVCALGDSRHL